MKIPILISFIIFFFYSCSSRPSQEELNYIAASKKKILYHDEDYDLYIHVINNNKDYRLGKYFRGSYPIHQVTFKFFPSGDKICFVIGSPKFHGIVVLDLYTDMIKSFPLDVKSSSVIDFLNNDEMFFTNGNRIYLYSFSANKSYFIAGVDNDEISSISVNPERTYLAVESWFVKEKLNIYSVLDIFDINSSGIKKTYEKEFIGWLKGEKIFVKDSIYKEINLNSNKTINFGKVILDSLEVGGLYYINEDESIISAGILQPLGVNKSNTGIFLIKKNHIQRLFSDELFNKNICDIYYKE